MYFGTPEYMRDEHVNLFLFLIFFVFFVFLVCRMLLHNSQIHALGASQRLTLEGFLTDVRCVGFPILKVAGVIQYSPVLRLIAPLDRLLFTLIFEEPDVRFVLVDARIEACSRGLVSQFCVASLGLYLVFRKFLIREDGDLSIDRTT
jgi:hypothetical protein